MKSQRVIVVSGIAALILLGALMLALRQHRKAAESGAMAKEVVQEQGPYKRDELMAMIGRLSSPIEEQRRKAEKDLAQAGLFAQAALNEAAQNPGERAGEALTRLTNKLRFAALDDFDYLNAFPENAMLAARIPNMKAALEKARATQLGAIFMRPELTALRKDLADSFEKGLSGEKLFSFDDIHGQVALGNFNASAGDLAAGVSTSPPGKGHYWGLLFELRGQDPQSKYAETTERSLATGGSIYEYDNIECVAGTDANAHGRGAHTRTGKNVFFGNDKESLHTLMRAVLDRKTLNARPDVLALREALGKNCDVFALANFQQDLKETQQVHPEAGELIKKMMDGLGYKKIGIGGWSETIHPAYFEDRVIHLMGEPPTGLFAALSTPDGAPAPLSMFDKIPSNAMAAAAGYIDGAKLETAISDLYASAKKSNPEKFQANPLDELRKNEAALGLKPGELLGHIKGEACAWVTLGGFPLGLPDVCAALTAESKTRADECAAILARVFEKIPAPLFAKNTYKNHTLYTLDLSQLAPNLPKVNLNWAADGNQIYFTSSTRALQMLLNNLERRAPGLLTQPNVTAALGTFTAEERRGAVLYADMSAILTIGGAFVLPQLQSNSTLSAEAKKGLTELPPLGDLARGLHPLMGFAAAKKERLEALLQSPVPLSGMALFLVK